MKVEGGLFGKIIWEPAGGGTRESKAGWNMVKVHYIHV
jgi:hypothetical protein